MGKIRLNPIGIQMIPELLHQKLYGQQQPRFVNKNVNNILNQLKKSVEGIQFNTDNKSHAKVDYPWKSAVKYLPRLKNDNVIEHLDFVGRKYSLPYLKCIQNLLKISDLIENKPARWNFEKGWTRYVYSESKGYSCEMVDYPFEDSLVFDMEVCMDERNKNRPTLAVALTPEAWYSWCGESLINVDSDSNSQFFNLQDILISDLIPMGTFANKERLIVGHNVSFDRSFIKEQYYTDLDRTRFLDTMSLHICVSGLNQDQKMFAIRNGNPWDEISSLNNLGDVYKLYCKPEQHLSKDARDIFIKGSLNDVYNNFQDLMTYCSNDVSVTLKIMKSLFPLFAERFPHPVTLAGILEMSVMYLPVNKKIWKRYLNESQSIYHEYKDEINQTLKEIACESCSYLENNNYQKDPWLWDLDWDTKVLSLKKSFDTSRKEKLTSENVVEQLYATSKHLKKYQPILPGYPKWFVELCGNSKYIHKIDEINFNELFEFSQFNISPKLRVIPKLLKLMWNGFPLHFDKNNGWGYLVVDPAQEIHSDHGFDLLNGLQSLLKNNQSEIDKLKKEDGIKGIVDGCLFYKLPHKDGPNSNVGNPLGKDFIYKIEDGTLKPFISAVKDLVMQQSKISYWVNSSKRILSQLVISYDDQNNGSILPRVVVSGTVTRRAVEPTWLTASNSYPQRLGSELKGIIQCPDGYSYVGADVDSQELWIASLLGDCNYSGIQGSTGLGWMTLQGDKSLGTDMHSITANSINITRDEAKVLNYARIYGSGPNFAARFLKQSNPNLTEDEARTKAKKIFVETKGYRQKYKKYIQGDNYEIVRQWVGGSESCMFNKLEEIATCNSPTTPFLKCRISRALEPSAVGHDFITSRINWVVQSSAVDFLHILLVSMKWLMEEYQIEGRFSISIHDEIRYIINDKHKYRAALALQFSNLIARSFFTSTLNLNDLPASVAFFSSIEIDKCLRKEVKHDCKTPSNPLGLSKGYGVPLGESLDISRLLHHLQDDHEFNKLFK